MAGKITVECPACTAKLNLSDSSKLGKKIRCPKCAEVFQATAPDDDFEDDFDDEPKQSGTGKRGASGRDSSRGTKKGAKPGKSAGDSSSLPLIIGGSIALIALAGAGIYFSGALNSSPLPAAPMTTPAPMAGMPMSGNPATVAPPAGMMSPGMPSPGMPGPPAASALPQPTPAITPAAPAATAAIASTNEADKTFGLGWMPAGTDYFIHLKPAEIWQAPLLKTFLTGPNVETVLKEFESKVGVPLTDIDSISMGIVNLFPTAIKAQANRPMNAAPPIGGPPMPFLSVSDLHYVVVVKTKRPIVLKTLFDANPGAVMREQNGKSYFDVPENPPHAPSSGAWLPDPNTIVVATSKELIASIEQGETPGANPELASLDPKPQVVIAGLVPGMGSGSSSTTTSAVDLPPFLQPALKANEQYGLKMGSLGLTVKGGFDLQISTLSSSAEGARKFKELVEPLIGQLRPMFNIYKSTAPPLLAELGEMLLSNLKIEEQNAVVKVSTSVPDSAQEKLEQLPAVVMMMAMMGGMGGPAGQPGFGLGMNLGSVGSGTSAAENNPGELIGETSAVDAASVDGLPEGLALTARTGWSSAPASPAADGKTTETVEFVIDVTGDGLETICAATGVASKSITAEGGSSLKRSKQSLPGGIDGQKTFLPFDVNQSTRSDHPPQTLRVRLPLETNSKLPAKLGVVEGSFKILIAKSSQEHSISEAWLHAKTPLTEPEFKEAGLKLIRSSKDVIPQTLKLQCNKSHSVGRVEGRPGDLFSMTEVERGATIQRLYSNHADGKFPDDFEISFKIYSQLKEQTVTFRFEDVPLPDPASKPGATGQQQSPFPQQFAVPPNAPLTPGSSLPQQ